MIPVVIFCWRRIKAADDGASKIGWLVSRGKVQQGKTNMTKIRGESWPEEEIDEEIREISFFVEVEATVEKSTSYLDCLKGTDLRRTMISLLILCGQQFFGVAFFAGYAHHTAS